ncbi:sulfotransferase [Candidatus Pelagibacter sp.]|nr:sulfotransferase [Candidatus Pelagibacter sp.]
MNLIVETQKLQNYLRVKDYKTVVYGCEKLISKFPNNPFLFNLLGLALHGSGKYLIAIDRYKKALDLDLNFLPAMNNLANSYKSIGNFVKAENYYNKAIEAKPNYFQAINNYANLKTLIFDYSSAIELYEKALKIKEKDITILFSLANAYHAIGNIKKTKEIISEIFNYNPKHTSTHKLLSSIVNYLDDSANLNEMENLILESHLSNSQTVDLSFALGKAYEDIKKYKDSFFYLKKANMIKKKEYNYDIKDEQLLIDSIKKNFEGLNFKNRKKFFDKRKAIFICGMPRSGTTLVEQIIASHNDVFGAGELIYIQRIINKYLILENQLSKEKLNDELELGSNLINEDYFNMINYHKFKEINFTDKAPQNFRWIGILKLFFPNSKIIYCKRNAKDNCLSIYKNFFASEDMKWAFDEKNIANYYNLHLNLMDFWKSKFGEEIYEINYEELVSNKEQEIKKLIKFCELDWDPICLEHHKSKKTPIKTVSISQARKPVYKSSVNSNSNYENYLSDMFELL